MVYPEPKATRCSKSLETTIMVRTLRDAHVTAPPQRTQGTQRKKPDEVRWRLSDVQTPFLVTITFDSNFCQSFVFSLFSVFPVSYVVNILIRLCDLRGRLNGSQRPLLSAKMLP